MESPFYEYAAATWAGVNFATLPDAALLDTRAILSGHLESNKCLSSA